MIVLEERLIPLPAESHEGFRLPVVRRPFFLHLFARSGSVGAVLLRRRVGLLPGRVLVEDLDRDLRVLHLDDLADFDVVDAAEEGAFAGDLAFRKVQVVHRARQTIGAVCRVCSTLGDPGMFETFINSDSLVNINGQHAIDQIQRRVSHTVPVWGRIVETTHLDLLGEIVRILAGVEFIRERGKAAETDVENDAEGPDVDGTRVFAVSVVFENFGRDICCEALVRGNAWRGNSIVTAWGTTSICMLV